MLLRALIFGICFSFFGGMVCDFGTVYASNTGTENVEQNRKKKKKSTKKKTYKKKSNSNVSSFGQAYRDARKKGLKTFKHNGKTYTTVKDTDSKKNVTNNKKVTSTNKKTNRESASYKNVSFGSAYKDAKKKGISTFTWNGKKYTTEKTVKKNTKNTKSNKKKYTKSKKKSNKKYSKKKTSNKKRYTTTKGIRIQVFPEFVQEHSDTDNNLFYFKYKIIISNNSDKPVTLVSRHWEIINSEGDTEVVDGPGVIGKTPYIEPGEEFEYESYCPLDTSWGTMDGAYSMQDDDGNTFDVEIGRFYLCIPVTA